MKLNAWIERDDKEQEEGGFGQSWSIWLWDFRISSRQLNTSLLHFISCSSGIKAKLICITSLCESAHTLCETWSKNKSYSVPVNQSCTEWRLFTYVVT